MKKRNTQFTACYQCLRTIMLVIPLFSIYMYSQAQTFETNAPAYLELQPQFIEEGEFINVYFNLKFEDRAGATPVFASGDDVYDHISRLRISWNGQIIYALEHSALENNPYGLGSDFSTTSFTSSRFDNDNYEEHYYTALAPDIFISRTHTSAYGSNQDVVQARVRIRIGAMERFIPEQTTAAFEVSAHYYDRRTHGTSTDDAGTHQSQAYTVKRFTTDSQGNQFELAPGYHELQPQFIEEGDYMNLYFNMEIWDEPGSPYVENYDHIGEMNFQWDGVIVYALSHNGIVNLNLGSNYATHSPTTARWESPGSYTAYIHNALTNDVEVTYTNSVAYGGTEEVTQVRVRALKSAFSKVQSSDTKTGKFRVYGTYRDRVNNSSSDVAAGTHFSKDFTFHKRATDAQGNSFELAPGYHELQPQFIEETDFFNLYYNLEIWDEPNAPYQANYDHLGEMNLQWEGVIIYAAAHDGIKNLNLGSNYTTHRPGTARWESPTSYTAYVHNNLLDDVEVTYTNSVAYEGTEEVTQVRVKIPKSAVHKVQSGNTVTGKFRVYGTYRDRVDNDPSDVYSGTHYSKDFTFYKPEENNSGDDETGFSASLNSDEGYVEIRFRAEKHTGEAVYDHLQCISIEKENLTTGGTEPLVRIGHTSLSCDHNAAWPTTNQSGTVGDQFRLSWVGPEIDIARQPQSNGDLYYSVRHYFDNDEFGDQLRYYITGSFYVQDYYDIDKTVDIVATANQATIDPDANYTMPTVTGFTVTPSPTACAMDLSWDAITPFGVASKNRVVVFRDGERIATYDPQVQTAFVDTDIEVGRTYSYQVASLYGRTYNEDLIGLPTAAETAVIPRLQAPAGIGTSQADCDGSLTVSWVWQGATNPDNFVIQRSETGSGFESIVNNLDGSLRDYTDTGVQEGIQYSYRVAAVGGVCDAIGDYSPAKTHSRDTIDLAPTIVRDALETSKGYFADRTELFWELTGKNEAFVNRFRIYARELGTNVVPTLVESLERDDRSWFHERGEANVIYEYFVTTERVIETECGFETTKSFDIEAVNGLFDLPKQLPDSGVAYSIGLRNPTAVVNGNITYTGGVAVPNVKVIVEPESQSPSKSLYFNGSSRVEVPNSGSLQLDTALTLSAWVKPERLDPNVMLFKAGSYGMEFNGTEAFMFIRDSVDQSAHLVRVPAEDFVVGNWVNLTCTYSSATGALDLYVNGVKTGATVTVPEGRRIINASNQAFLIGDYTSPGFEFQGHMDEIRIYNRALSAAEVQREYGRITKTNAPGLVAYWKVFEGAGDHIYDAARLGSFFYRNDGKLKGVAWSDDIPSQTQLGIAGYTNAFGNFSIEGIPFSGSGENFKVTPTVTLGGVVHVFDPASKSIYLGEGNIVENGVDFTDISVFKLSGQILFDFENEVGSNTKSVGSEGVEIYLDGLTKLVDINDNPITTDSDGRFEVSIPIGHHYIEFRKNGHNFKNSGRWPAQGRHDFQADVTGLQILDQSTHKFVGTVSGGTQASSLPVFSDLQINNIGQAYFELTSLDQKIKRTVVTDSIKGTFEVDLPPLRYTISSIRWKKDDIIIVPSAEISALDLSTAQAYVGLTEIDSTLVPQLRQIYPSLSAQEAIGSFTIDSITSTHLHYSWILNGANFVSTKHSWVSPGDTVTYFTDTDGSGFANGTYDHEVAYTGNNAYNEDGALPVALLLEYENAGGDRFEVGVEMDVFTPNTLLRYDTLGFTYTHDTLKFNVRRDFAYRKAPGLEVVTAGDTLFTGEPLFGFQGIDAESIDLTQLPYPSFFTNETYTLEIRAAEEYKNKDNDRTFSIPVTDGFVTVNNGIGPSFILDDAGDVQLGQGNQLPLNDEGLAVYHFFAGDPSTTQITSNGQEKNSFTRSINVSLNTGEFNASWPADPVTDPQLVYVIGAVVVPGASFVTQAPETVEFILRDPPGSDSYAFREAGTTYSASEEFIGTGFGNLAGSAKTGFDVKFEAGGSFAVHGAVHGKGNLKVSGGLKTSLEGSSGSTVERSLEMTERIQTNDEPIELGASDVFVSKSHNIQTGLAFQVQPIAVELCAGKCFGDIITLEDGSQFQMGVVQSTFVSPDGLPTYAVYTQDHIETLLIPDLVDLRTSFFTRSNSEYVSHLPADHSMFGSNNDDPKWGAQASSTNFIRTEVEDLDGPSYRFDNGGDNSMVDSVRWINQQIRLWREALAFNEIEKWAAINTTGNQENISLASGVTLERSVNNTASSLSMISMESTAAINLGLEADVTFVLAVTVELQGEIGLKTATTSTRGKESSNTIGYVLKEPDENDALSIDIAPGVGANGPVFSTVGGQTSCPYEPAIYMKYATPEFIDRAIIERQEFLLELEKRKSLTDILKKSFEDELAKIQEEAKGLEAEIKKFLNTQKKMLENQIKVKELLEDVQKVLESVADGALNSVVQKAVGPLVSGVNGFIGSLKDINIPVPFAGNISPFSSIPEIPTPDSTGNPALDIEVVGEIVKARVAQIEVIGKQIIDDTNEVITKLQNKLKKRLLDINDLSIKINEFQLDLDKVNGEIDVINNQITQFQQLKAVLQNADEPIALSNATLQREKPNLSINGAEVAQVYNVPAEEKANFTLLLNNESESGDAQFYAMEVLKGSNPDGLVMTIDGLNILQPREFLVPGGSAIQKILTVERGPFKYDYKDVKVLFRSTCQYDPTSNTALIADTVSFDVQFLPTCSNVEVILPEDNWVGNNHKKGVLPITVGGYDINSTGLENIRVQYKEGSASEWTLLETYYRDEKAPGWQKGASVLPLSGNTFTYDWNFAQLPDGEYDIRAVSNCALASATSAIHSGVIDKVNPHPFGNPLPADGVLSPGDDILIQFNEPVNAGLLSTSDFDIRGVLNGTALRHDAAVSFNGTNSYVEIPAGINLTRKSFSFDFYFKRNGTGEQVLISQGSAANAALEIGINPSDKVIFTVGAVSLVGSTTIRDDRWHHLAVTYNSATSDAIVFLDGQPDAINNSFAIDFREKGPITLGKGFKGAHFSGHIHELRIWNKALSTAEVTVAAGKRVARTTPGLIANWEMEEAYGNIAREKVKLLHATVHGERHVFPLGNSLGFNGTAYAETKSPALTGEQSFTVSFWVRTTAANATVLSNGKGDGTDANVSGWSFNINASGQVEAWNNGTSLTLGDQKINDGNWHHVAMSCNRLGNTIGFIDGTEGKSRDSKAFKGFGGSKLWIGTRGWFEGVVEQRDQTFNGQLDEVRIWNTNRSLKQISRDQYNKLSGAEGGLLVYYPMETYVDNSGVLVSQGSLKNQIEAVNTDDIVLMGVINFSSLSPNIKLPRPVEKVNFSFSANEDKIVLSPTDVAARIENTTLEITVRNIRDLNGNVLQNPVTWTAFVDRNQVTWGDDKVVMEKPLGEGLVFESKVINTGGAVFTYNLSNMPAWLTAEPASGTLEPLSSERVRFTISKGLNIGSYLEDIYLTTEFGYAERLELELEVYQPPPTDWVVNPADFQFSMSVTGQIEYDGVISREENDILAAFVNGQIRGLANLEYVQGFDNYQAYLSIYSNVTSGEQIEFRVWNSKEGRIHTNITPTYSFESDVRHGSPSSPVVFKVPDRVRREVPVVDGWQWISFNLESSNMKNLNDFLTGHSFQEGDLIKSQYTFDLFDPGIGWFGSLTTGGGLQTNQAYKMRTKGAGTLIFEGNIIKPETTSISIKQGWNWIGFISQRNMNVNEALAGFTAQVGDEIKSQRDFAVYTGPVNGWVGSLETMIPGEGYLVNATNAGNFTYPKESVVNGRSAPPQDHRYFDLGAFRIDPSKYSENMSVIAEISGAQGDTLLAFVRDEVRGIAISRHNPSTEAPVYFLLIYGHDGQEEINFKAFENGMVSELSASSRVSFAANSQVGAIQSPFELNKTATGVDVSTSSISIHPNPFTSVVKIQGRFITSEKATMEVRTVSGQLIRRYEKEMNGNVFDFVWDGRGADRTVVRPGVYLLRITTDHEVSTFRVIKQ